MPINNVQVVSLMQSTDRNEFRRAFAAATGRFIQLLIIDTFTLINFFQVHDMFNWLTVITLLPVEISFHYLEYMTEKIINLGEWKQDNGTKTEFLQKFTKPLTKLVIVVS